jgi:hypothetical protein
VLAMTDRICPLNNRACCCNPNAADKKLHPCALANRIGVAIRMMASPYDGEAAGATYGLRRLLPNEGLAFSDLAVLVENCNGAIEEKKYSDVDCQLAFERGVKKGRKECGGCRLSADYFDDDGEPRWLEMTKYCLSNPAKTSLKPNEQEFLDELPAKLRWRTPTPPMGGFLLSIFWKLRRSLT